MRTVGLRELKNRLGAYVGLVRAGESLAVTDRGRVVAELGPPHWASSAHAALARLAHRGELTLATPANRGGRAALYPAMPRALRRHTAAKLIDAERGAS